MALVVLRCGVRQATRAAMRGMTTNAPQTAGQHNMRKELAAIIGPQPKVVLPSARLPPEHKTSFFFFFFTPFSPQIPQVDMNAPVKAGQMAELLEESRLMAMDARGTAMHGRVHSRPLPHQVRVRALALN